MKKRPKLFLAENTISHKSEIFNYIRELHTYLWRFVRCAIPSASGKLDRYVDDAIEELENYPSIWAEGNNGGDYIKITKLNDNELHLEIGCYCVVIVSHKVPVEFLTNLFYDLTLEVAPTTEQDRMVELAKKYIHYTGSDSEAINKSLISKVEKMEREGL